MAVRRLGRIPYAEGLELQAQLVLDRQAGRIPDTLLLLEHDPVFTLGRNARQENVLFAEAALRAKGFEVFETGRGGDVTYHGPGQIVGYPILDLKPDRQDVHRYVRDLEEVMMRTCAHYGIAARRIQGATGCWVGDEKIGAIGVRLSRWVTSHGFAFNVNVDLTPFELIVPCGIREKGVTSLAKLLGRDLAIEEVTNRLALAVLEVFERRPAASGLPLSMAVVEGRPGDLATRSPALPGSELVDAGLRDLADGRETVPALLVASFSRRLRELGLPVPQHSIPHPELRLFQLLAHARPDAHHHYNGLVQRLVSFVQAAECSR